MTAAVVLAVVGGGLEHARQRAHQPVSLAPSGAYPVGRTTELWADRARTDELSPRGGEPRVLSVWSWYPAAAGAGGPESGYAPDGWAALHRFGWGVTAADRVRTGTRDGVPFAAGRFPVVVLLPDLGWAAPQYTAVASSLAARGAVVVGVTPTYSARLTVLNGRPVRASAAGRDPDRRDQLLAVWAADARFAAERAVRQFGGHVRADRTVYVGHAFGGTAALAACRADPRCGGAVSLDGEPDGEPDGPAGPVRPTLLLGAAATTPAARALVAAGRAWAYPVAGAGRLAFTDYAAYHVAAPVRWTLPLGEADGRRVLEITSAYLGAFLATATGGAAWAAPSFPEVRAAAMLSR